MRSRAVARGMDFVRSARYVVAALRENYAPLVAGSLAYSAFVSILPLLTLALVVASVVGGEQFVDQVLRLADQYLNPAGQDMFAEAIRDQTGRAAVSVVSVVLLLWSGLRIFRTLDTSFSLFYNTTGNESILGRLADALLVLLMLGVAIVGSVAIGYASSAILAVPLGWLLGPLLLVLVLVLAFLPIYYVFPDTDVSVREVLPGVVLAAVGWAVLQSLFQLYANYAGQYEVYGTLGAVLLVLTWLYLAAGLLLVGVAVNVVLAGRTRLALASPPSRTTMAAKR